MAALIVQANYDALKEIAKRFQNQSSESDTLHERVKRVVAVLESGGWRGDAAEAFFAEMQGDVFPAISRLTAVMDEAGQVTLQLTDIIQTAEEEAADLFRQWGIQGQEAPAGAQHSFAGAQAEAATSGSAEFVGPPAPPKAPATLDEIREAANKTTVDPNVNEWTMDDLAKWKAPFIGGPEVLREFKEQWVRGYKDTIKQAAAAYGIPEELLAGVAYVEVGGDPLWIDDVAYGVRKFDHMDPEWGPDTITRKPNETSFGNVSMQIRRAAATLGYDPNNLTSEQESAIIGALKDPRQNIYITAKHLAELRDIDFKGRDAASLTKDEIRVIATRYNRGPDLSLDKIKQNTSYGDFIVDRVGADKLKDLVK